MKISKTKNSPLHEAVIEDNLSLLSRLLQKNMQIGEIEQIDQKNHLGMTPRQLARYLGRKKCLSILQKSDINDEKNIHGNEEFVKGVESIPQVVFADFPLLEKIVKKCRSIHDFAPSILYRNVYYQEELEHGKTPRLSLKWIDDKIGYGVFTKEALFPSRFVIEFAGVVKKRKKDLLTSNRYCMRYPIETFFKKKYTIDGSVKSNLSRFINHSYRANLDLLALFDGFVIRLILVANRKINPEEQLFFDYGKEYWDSLSEIPNDL